MFICQFLKYYSWTFAKGKKKEDTLKGGYFAFWLSVYVLHPAYIGFKLTKE